MIEKLLSDLKQGLFKLYGNKLKGTYLFGSYARGDSDPESDVDVLLVLEDYERYGAEIDRCGDLVSALSLKYAITISTIFMKEQEWSIGDTPLLRNVREEAISI